MQQQFGKYLHSQYQLSISITSLYMLPSKDPLHGKTLESIVTELVEYYGWEGLYEKININSFKSNPSIKSSLTFLRKTDWARKKVESLYLFMLRKKAKNNPS